MREPARVLIVDDSAFMRRAVERILSDSPAIRIVGTAANGEEAVAAACELRPDVVVMDVNMPGMDGLEALERIMARCPVPVLMLSTLTQAGAAITLRALELGAVDFIDKSQAATSMDIYQLAPLLRDKVLAVSQAEPAATAAQPSAPRAVAPEAAKPAEPAAVGTRRGTFELIAIGASTGGPRALSEILPRLPAELPAAVVVAQHMPSGFTATLADRLDERCALEVREARDGDPLAPGTVLIAPGGCQLQVVRRASSLQVRVRTGPRDLLHHPSVDVLLGSVADAVGSAAIGVVLTGMGEDGADGLKRLRNAGGTTLAESSETAVIYGMPRAAREYAEFVLPLHRIGPTLVQLCGDPEPRLRSTL